MRTGNDSASGPALTHDGLRKILSCSALKPTEKIVLIAIVGRMGTNGHSFPSFTRIASDCAMSRRAVAYAVEALERGGFLVIDHRAEARKVNRYATGQALEALLNATQTVARRCKPCTSANHAPVQTVHSTGANRAPQVVQTLHTEIIRERISNNTPPYPPASGGASASAFIREAVSQMEKHPAWTRLDPRIRAWLEHGTPCEMNTTTVVECLCDAVNRAIGMKDSSYRRVAGDKFDRAIRLDHRSGQDRLACAQLVAAAVRLGGGDDPVEAFRAWTNSASEVLDARTQAA